MSPTILITGFAPFAGAAENPSWRAVRLVPALLPAHRVVIAELPVEFTRAADQLDALVAEHLPGLVIATGVASRRTQVTPEQVAVNQIDARIADNAGRQPRQAPIVTGGPASYTSTLPLTAAVTAARRAGVPAEISADAGRYVCNEVFYRLMRTTADDPGIRAGFVHVPPTLPPADVARALAAVVEVCVADLRTQDADTTDMPAQDTAGARA